MTDNAQVLTYRPLPGARLNMAHPLTKGLVGCWLFNENAGIRAMDLSPYQNHGTLVNFGSPPRRPFNGLVFDGVNDYVSFGTIPRLNFTSEDFSVEQWVWWSGTCGQSASVLFQRGSWQADGWETLIEGAPAGFQFFTHQVGAVQVTITSSNSVAIGGWTHFIVSRKGASATPYVNGVKDIAWTTGHIDPVSNVNRVVNLGAGDSWTLNGRVALVRIYNRALNVSEIQRLYLEPYGMFELAQPVAERAVQAAYYYRLYGKGRAN